MPERNLLSSWFAANNFVPFNDRRDADPRRSIFRLPVYANDLTHGANENFGSAGDFGRQGQRDVEFGSRAQVLVDREINARAWKYRAFFRFSKWFPFRPVPE